MFLNPENIVSDDKLKSVFFGINFATTLYGFFLCAKLDINDKKTQTSRFAFLQPQKWLFPLPLTTLECFNAILLFGVAADVVK